MRLMHVTQEIQRSAINKSSTHNTSDTSDLEKQVI